MSKGKCCDCSTKTELECANCHRPYCQNHGDSGALCSTCQELTLPYQTVNELSHAQSRLKEGRKHKKILF